MKIRDLTNEQLIQLEAKKRNILVSLNESQEKNTHDYEVTYHHWFMLRTAGVDRGVFEGFVPTKNDL